MSDSPASNDALVTHLCAIMPDLCDFAIAFFRLFVLDSASLPLSDTELAMEIKEEILPISFYTILAIPQVYELASAHTGLVDCFTRVWVLVGTEQQPRLITGRYLELLLNILERSGPKSPASNEFRDAVDQLPCALITACILQRVISDLHATPIDVHSVHSIKQNFFMLLQCCTSVEVYYPCFASHRAAKWCCIIMKQLMSRKHVLPSGYEQTVTQAVDVTLMLLRIVFLGGRSVMAEAIEHGFIECVFRCQPLLDHQESTSSTRRPLGPVFAELIDLLNGFTMHRQVLREAHKALKKVLSRNLEDDIEKEGPLWNAWERFRDVVDERWQAKADYIEAGPKDWCDNKPCQAFASSQRRLKQCGCSVTYYCSRICQRDAWRAGHKEECEARQKSIKEGSPVPTTQRDIQFFFAMAEGDYNFHSDEINRRTNEFLRARRTTTVLPYPVVIQFNYTVVPRKVTITTADEVPKEGNWEEIVSKGRMNVGRLVYLTVPDKAKPFQVFGIVDEPR
ncbi:hypothetical protein BDZ89DRAFT_125334 [Hymenopellis radicata]|nr:hypothetical protein BDZ89DRAFT_125334 [Hymenopellis radicata]